MTAEEYRRAGELFEALRELSGAQRLAAVDQACAGNDEVRSCVLRLLEADEQVASASFLQGRALEHAAELISGMGRSLSRGDKLGPYEIAEVLGAGGMGTVYKARDTRLNRDVAVKVAEERFSERFERECRAVAAINHPNICTLYDVGPNYLVMECIEGPTLAERIAAGPIPSKQALQIARQIAEALQAAHQKGIVHRDLKPENVKFTSTEQVKVLDFGLAKTYAADAGGQPRYPATRAGTILGTAAYMSPEQARGLSSDQRADIWSFGAVLFEMLTGRRAFAGDTVSETLASLLRDDIDFAALPPGTPAGARRLLVRCLERDHKKRLSDIGIAALELDDLMAGHAEPDQQPVRAQAPSPLSRWVALGALAVACIAGVGWWRSSRPAAPASLVRLRVDVDEDLPLVRSNLGGILALSQDGKRIALTLRGQDGKVRLYTRLLRDSRLNALPDTENPMSPFFSPDGRWIGFAADGKLKKISAEGGAALTLCRALALRGASWGDDGYIVAALTPATGLSRVSSQGGTPAPLTKLGPGERSHRWPQVLPGSQAVLFTASSAVGNYDDTAIEAVSLKDGARKLIQREAYSSRYLPTSQGRGHLVYIHESSLLAAPFDPRRVALSGPSVPVLGDVSSTPTSGADFDFSSSGIFVYLAGKAGAGWPVVWLSSLGNTKPLLVQPTGYATPRISPDGKRLAVAIPRGTGSDIWVRDVDRDSIRRLSFLSGMNRSPVWTPDGRAVVFQSDNGSNPGLYWVRSDGGEEALRLTDGKRGEVPTSISPDGRRLVFYQPGAATSLDIFTAALEGDRAHPRLGAPELFLGTPAIEFAAAFSPDGRWLAYSSNESGEFETYVRAFPGPGGRWQISDGGGLFPLWCRSSQQLLFRDVTGRIMAASYSVNGQSFVASKPRVWSQVPVLALPSISTYDLLPDGTRLAAILAASNAVQDSTIRLTFLMNFSDELRRQAP